MEKANGARIVLPPKSLGEIIWRVRTMCAVLVDNNINDLGHSLIAACMVTFW
jgi:hypothetical protein